MMFMLYKSNTTGVNNESDTVNSSGAHEFTPIVGEIHGIQSLVFCVVFCRSLLVLFLLAIVLYFSLRFAASDCPYGEIFTILME
jgi:hypothetical protein